jgi:hypothetical protein
MLPMIENQNGKELVLLECVSGRMLVSKHQFRDARQFMWSFSNLVLIGLYIFMAVLHFRTAANVRLGTKRESFPIY